MELFGGEQRRPVDYEARPLYRRNELEPSYDDTLPVIRDKAKKWREIIDRGHSLAVALGDIFAGEAPINYEDEARKTFTAQEEEQFDAWKRGVKMPPLNPMRDRVPVKGGEQARKRMDERAVALRRIYAEEALDAENAQWFHRTYERLIPLVTAVVSIARARRDASGGEDVDPRDMAERRTMTRLVKVASEVVKRYKEAINRLTGEIDVSMSVMQARRSAMAPPGSKKGAAKRPANEVRRLMGQPLIGRPVDYNRDAGEGRRARGAMRGVEAGYTGRPAPPARPNAEAARRAARPYAAREESPAYRPVSPPNIPPGDDVEAAERAVAAMQELALGPAPYRPPRPPQPQAGPSQEGRAASPTDRGDDDEFMEPE